jgi:transposase
VYSAEFKEEAVQMLLDGHTASLVAKRLGVSSPGLLYRWKNQILGNEGSLAINLETRVRDLEAELRQVQRERDILKKALSIFSRGG